MRAWTYFRKFILVTIVMSPLQSHAAPKCDIAADKQQMIEFVLCGGAAKEQEYKFSGSDCVSQSLSQRMQDTAIQIYMAKICGDTELAEKLTKGIIKANTFIGTLSQCTGQTVDVERVYRDAESYVANRAAGQTCSPSIRSTLAQNRSRLLQTTEMGDNPQILDQIYSKLGIKVDIDGNVSDR
jgi:hypothetical protein